MSGPTLTTRLLEAAREWVERLPSGLSSQMTVDVARRRLRLSHGQVEALTRRALRNVRALKLGEWVALPHAYDVRLEVSGWRLRVEVVLERVELSAGRYWVTLRTPGRVDLEESRVASVLMQGVLRAGAGRGAVRAVLERMLPSGLRWDGEVLEVTGSLPREGAVPARLFESSSLRMGAEHAPEGLWLSAEAWPGLMDLMQAVLGTELPRTPPSGHGT
jgi:hypothetical protein